MKTTTRWYSPRLAREVTVVRWGEIGTPLLIFPTAGGDAEEIERFRMIDVLAPYLAEGRIKVYSVDSVAGGALLGGEGTPEHRMWLLNEFQHFTRWEVVPAIRADCRTDHIRMATAGASIGAFQALATLCRYPEIFTRALCMSGTYHLERFIPAPPTDDLYYASPLHYLGGLSDERQLDALTRCRVILASGEGRAEDIGESWQAAEVLGRRGVPNRVDSWGPEWDHDWPTWREMVVRYLDELVPPPTSNPAPSE